jgi:hypothetical protein
MWRRRYLLIFEPDKSARDAVHVQGGGDPRGINN